MLPVELPGRGMRMGEAVPYASSLANLAEQVLDGIGLEVFNARPFALFGHSFGAWVAYEMYQELSRRLPRGWPLPVKVYISACRAPQLAGVDHDADKQHPTLGELSAPAFWKAFEQRYGRNPDLKEPYVREFVGRTLQADFRLLESYHPSILEPLAVPLCALCAVGDARCQPEQLSAWQQVAGPAGFRERWFEGVLLPGGWATEHRYVTDNPGSLLRFLRSDLPLLGGAAEEGYAGVDGPLPGVAGADTGALGTNLLASGRWCSLM